MIPRVEEAVRAHLPPLPGATAPPKGRSFGSRLDAARAASFTATDDGGTEAATATTTPATTTTTTLKPTGETLKAVDGHKYSEIESGVDKGMFLNQAAANPREGEAFRMVEQDGKTFHVYGSGASTVVEEMPK